MKYSSFGKKFSSDSGIVKLMEDLGEALNVNPNIIFMGGGNPARIPAMEALFAEKIKAVVNDDEARNKMLGVYQSPQGDEDFLALVAELLNEEFGWPITAENVAVSNGSQSAFFVIFNMFAGEFADGTKKHIQLPLAPEYLGYADVGLSEDFFHATQPTIELLENREFKYHVDFDQLQVTESTGALCVSRPTNPTGNVLSDDELNHLDRLAKENNIPLIIDAAYGTPFPSIIFEDVTPLWNDNTIVVLSLSKLGLPGARTGIVIAREDFIKDFTNISSLTTLSSGNLGPSIAKPLFAKQADGSRDVLRASRDIVKPFYRERARLAADMFREAMAGLPFYIHKPEGAIFLWLWFDGLPITCHELYERLKDRGVLISAGHHCFVGLDNLWRHRHECIRVTYCLDEELLREGIALIADEVRRAYLEAGTLESYASE